MITKTKRQRLKIYSRERLDSEKYKLKKQNKIKKIINIYIYMIFALKVGFFWQGNSRL